MSPIEPRRIIMEDPITGFRLVNFTARPDLGTRDGELWYTIIDRAGNIGELELIMPGPDGWTPTAGSLRMLRGCFRSAVDGERKRIAREEIEIRERYQTLAGSSDPEENREADSIAHELEART